MAVIAVQDLKKKYKTIEAVRGVSFEVQKGEIFGILGPNGAGKTTTLEIIETLKKQTSGSCIVLGNDNISGAEQIRKRIGVQLQSSEYLFYLTLCELITLFASLYKKRVKPVEILKLVGLEDKANAYVKDLSGGQKQRFTIATTLVQNPEIIFLDEPTTGLDPQARRNMWELIKDLHDTGLTIVMTTHYMEEAEFLCDRVAIMDQGQILKIGEPQKLIAELSDSARISFLVSGPIPQNDFSNIPGVRKVFLETPKVFLEVDNVEAVEKVIQKLREHHIPYSSLNLKTATLEDVYLNLTGREYEDE